MRLGSTAIDREAALQGVQQAQRQGEEALLVQLAEAGIDEVRLGVEEPS